MYATLVSFFLVLAPSFAQANEKTIQRIENYINRITTIKGDFTQDGPQRNQAIFRFSQGKFWLSRPGRMRFDYKSPNTLSIIADGLWLAIQDKDKGSFSRYPLSATPAKFLLDKNFSIKKNTRVKSFRQRKGKFFLALTSKDEKVSGTIELHFRKNPLRLDGWTIVDGQGLTTQVRFKNVQHGAKLNPALFFIKEKPVFRQRGRR